MDNFKKMGIKFSKDHFNLLFQNAMRDENGNRVKILFENYGLDLQNNYLHIDEVVQWMDALILKNNGDCGLYAIDPDTNKNYKFTRFKPAVVVDNIPSDAVVLPKDWKKFVIF